MKTVFIIFLCIWITKLSYAQKDEKLLVYFRFNEFKLDKASTAKIDSLLQTSAFKAFRIISHCDSVGDHSYNDKLSMQRAKSVKDYLVAGKITDSLISFKAMGKRSPLNTNATDESRALNRCVELYATPVKKLSAKKPANDSVYKIDKADIGSALRLENINFVGGKHKLLPGSIPTLQKLLKTMKQFPTLVIEIQGYICCEEPGLDGIDSDTQTRDLSVNRAKVVYDYLIEYGISPARMTYKGFGANNKLVAEFTEADRSINRRVEIKIISK